MSGKPDMFLVAVSKREGRTELIASGWVDDKDRTRVPMVLEGAHASEYRTGVKSLMLNDGTVITTGRDGGWFLNVTVSIK